MKRSFVIFFTTIIIAALCAPVVSFGSVNQDAHLYLEHEAQPYQGVCPDFHYILDDNKPYQLLFVGNSQIPKNSSEYYSLASYDLVFVQSVSQATDEHYPYVPYRNLVIRGTDKHYDVYACHFGDTEWTPIVIDKNQSYVYLSPNDSNGYRYAIVGSNYDPTAIVNGTSVEPTDYLFYVSENLDSEFSIVDYNGHIVKEESRPLTFLKIVSHYFVIRFLLPLIDYIAAEPLLLLIVFIGFCISLITILIKLYNIFTSRRRRKRG